MKQDDFDAAVRRYTEELMRYNARKTSAQPPPDIPKEQAPPVIEESAPVEAPAEPVIAVQEEAGIADNDNAAFSVSAEQVNEKAEPEEEIPEPAEAAMPDEAQQHEETNADEEEQNRAFSEVFDSLPESNDEFEEAAPDEFIDVSEEKKLEEKYRGRGILKVTAVTADGTYPLENAVVKISYDAVGGEEMYAVAKTGISGQIEPIALPAPVSDKYAKDVLFAAYTITAELDGYTSTRITDVPIFDGQITEQTFNLAPLPFGTESGSMNITSSEPKF